MADAPSPNDWWRLVKALENGLDELIAYASLSGKDPTTNEEAQYLANKVSVEWLQALENPGRWTPPTGWPSADISIPTLPIAPVKHKAFAPTGIFAPFCESWKPANRSSWMLEGGILVDSWTEVTCYACKERQLTHQSFGHEHGSVGCLTIGCDCSWTPDSTTSAVCTCVGVLRVVHLGSVPYGANRKALCNGLVVSTTESTWERNEVTCQNCLAKIE